MIRTAFAFAGGFVLIFLEAYIVLILKGYHTIEFGGFGPFINIWAMNFFLLFSIFTHIKLWYDQKAKTRHTTH